MSPFDPAQRLFALLCSAGAGLLLFVPFAKAADPEEIPLNWTMGEMLGHPFSNYVYVINETDGDLLAFDTDTGQVAAHRRFDFSLDGAHLFVPEHGSTLYFSVPSARKLYSMSPLLAAFSEVDLDVLIGSFVVADDGQIYALDESGASSNSQHNLVKIDLATGAESARLTAPIFDHGALLRMGSGGSRFYISNNSVAISGNKRVIEFLTAAGAPVEQDDHFATQTIERDFSIDDANDRLYRTTSGINGINAWNIAAEGELFWSFGGATGGGAVAQVTTSSSVWGGARSSSNGAIVEFSKADGAILRTIPIGSSNSSLAVGSLIDEALEVTANGRLIYGKRNSAIQGPVVDKLGFVDITSPDASYTPAHNRPFTPAGLSASDGTLTNQIDVTWNASPRATHYLLYRNTIDDSTSATQLGGQLTATTFADTTVSSGNTYFYWVRAENLEGLSPFGSSDQGNLLAPPAAPTTFTATDGIYLDRVYVAKNNDPDATGFRIYRSTSNDFSSATEIGSSTSFGYFDTTAVAGQLYYYWGRQENAAGLGPESAADSGYAGDLNAPQTAPANVNAEDNVNPFRVHITWDAHAEARSYEVLRNTSNDPGSATVIGSTTLPFYDDATAVELVVYHYWVRAVNTLGTGPLSAPDTGSKAEYVPPATVTGVNATDGISDTEVTITWDSVPFKDRYWIYRHTSNNVEQATLILITSGLDITDQTAHPGVTYYYWVKAVNYAGEGDFSTPDTGYATVPPPPASPPQEVTASDGTWPGYITVDYSAVGHAAEYRIYRSTDNNVATATLVGTNTGVGAVRFFDRKATPLQPYYYWVKAWNAAGETQFSPSDVGHADFSIVQNTYATKDTFTDKVRVTWNSVYGVSRYRITRYPLGDPESIIELGYVNADTLRFEDFTADPGQDFVYRIESEVAGGILGGGLSDTGSRAVVLNPGNEFAFVKQPRDVDFDMLRRKAYITTKCGVVESYDLGTRRVTNDEWNTDGTLSGADISPGAQQLLLAQHRWDPESQQACVNAIQLQTGELRTILIPEELQQFQNASPTFDVTVLDNDIALATPLYGHDPLRTVNIATDEFSLVNLLHSSADGINSRTFFSCTPDRSRVLIQEGNSTAGNFYGYDASSAEFGRPLRMQNLQHRGAISPDGTLAAMVSVSRIEIYTIDDGTLVHTLDGLRSGMVFDPVRPVLYATDPDTDQIRAFRTDDWTEIAVLDLGASIDHDFHRYEEGHLAISDDGSYLAVTFFDRVRILRPGSFLDIPAAPTSITTSENPISEGIATMWDNVADATAYEVYRSATDDSSSAVQIAANVEEGAFLDTTSVAGTTYYYWIKSINYRGQSDFSDSVSGERRIAAPTNLTASDATDTSKVIVNWTDSVSATGYSVLRNNVDDTGTASELIAGLTNTSYNDTTATPGSNYFYWVIASNGSGPSEVSVSDSGSRRLLPPANLTLDLTSAAAVTVSWEAVSGAGAYRIYRGPSNDPLQATEIGTATEPSYADSTATVAVPYFWFAQATSGPNAGDLSVASASGARIFSPPSNPAASTGMPSQINLSWSTVAGPVESYEIRRSTNNDFATATTIAEPTATAFADTTAPQGATMHYWIRARSATINGEWTTAFVGSRSIAAFADFIAARGLTGSEAEPTADPDNDLSSNFDEWAQGGSDPTDPSSRPPLILDSQDIAGENYFTISYLRIVGGTENGATYQHPWVHYTTSGIVDLPSDIWDQEPLPAPPAANLESPPGGYEWGCVRLPVSSNNAPQGFMKLEISAP